MLKQFICLLDRDSFDFVVSPGVCREKKSSDWHSSDWKCFQPVRYNAVLLYFRHLLFQQKSIVGVSFYFFLYSHQKILYLLNIVLVEAAGVMFILIGLSSKQVSKQI